MLRQRQLRIARSLHRKLPEVTDLLGLQPRARTFQRARVDAGGSEQARDVETFRGEHFRDALHPDGGRPLGHALDVPSALLALAAIRLAPSVTDASRPPG